MRSITEGFELDFGSLSVTGAVDRDKATPISGIASAHFICSSAAIMTAAVRTIGHFQYWVGFLFKFSNTHSSGNVLVRWMDQLGVEAGRFEFNPDGKVNLIINGQTKATGYTIFQNNTVYHFQAEIWMHPTIGGIRTKINDAAANYDINYYGATHTGNTVPNSSSSWISAFAWGAFGLGAGEGWIDDIVVNDGYNVTAESFSWPGMIQIRSSRANAAGTYDEWTQADLSYPSKIFGGVVPTNALDEPVSHYYAGIPGGGGVTINNAGTIATDCNLMAFGGSVDPRFDNLTTGQHIEFEGTVPTGWELIVQTGYDYAFIVDLAHTEVMISWTGKVKAGSTYFQLAPGDNSISSTCGGDISWKESYRGDWQGFTFNAHPTPPYGAALESINHHFVVFRGSECTEPVYKVIPGTRISSTDRWLAQQLAGNLHCFPDTTRREFEQRMRTNPATGGQWALADADSMECIFKDTTNIDQID
jgi:hypothetical protein